GALVDHAGGWVEGQMKPLGRMPPLLLVHGQRDHRVPYKKYVQPLYSYLEQQHIAYESRVFPTQGHKFKPAELEDVRAQAIEFFRQHLKPPNRVKGSASRVQTPNAQRPTSNAQLVGVPDSFLDFCFQICPPSVLSEFGRENQEEGDG